MKKIEEVEVEWDDKPVKVKVGAVSYGDYNEALRKAMVITMTGNIPSAKVDSSGLEETMVLKSIKEAPFPISLDNIRKLSIQDAKKIYRVANELSGLTEKEKDFLPDSPEVTQSVI